MLQTTHRAVGSFEELGDQKSLCDECDPVGTKALTQVDRINTMLCLLIQHNFQPIREHYVMKHYLKSL